MLVFESDDLEQTEEFLSAHYAPMQIGSGSEQVTTRVARAASQEVTIDRLDIGFEMAYDGEPLGRICLCDMQSGSIDSHGPDGTAVEDFGAGDLFSLSPPDRGYAGTVSRARYTITMIDPVVLTHVASPARGHDTVELLGHRPVDSAAIGRLRAAIDHVDHVVLSDPAAAASELVRGSAVRYLAAQVLAAFPNSSTAGPSIADGRAARPAALRRAVAYIDATADADLSPAAVAAAAHVSIRSLQLAFRRHLDTTPMGYLRSVRMARARRELSAAQPGDGATVVGIALRWGFANQGRFGQAYQQAYGETPGTTLRRLR